LRNEPHFGVSIKQFTLTPAKQQKGENRKA
jgi:hypothetical protein